MWAHIWTSKTFSGKRFKNKLRVQSLSLNSQASSHTHTHTHTFTTVVNPEPKASMLGLYTQLTSLNCGLFTWMSVRTLLYSWNSVLTLRLCGFHTFTLVFNSITDPLIWSTSNSLKMYREKKATVPSVQDVSFCWYLNEWCINAAHVSWSVHNSFINTKPSGKRKLF